MLNFGTVGSGWITDEYIKGAKDSGFWELTAVYSRTKERGEAYAKKHGAAHVFTDAAEMAGSDSIDAVYIASPNVLHYEYSKLFLQHKKHVICEKPLCAQADKVRELQALARANGVVYLEAIMFMHLPQKALLEEALAKIGPISMAKLDFCQRSSKLDDYLAGNLPNIFNREMETGAFMDLGVYCVYPALYLFGMPESFSADARILRGGADGSGILTLRYPDKLVTLTYSKLGQASAGSEFQGPDGTVYVDSISRLADMMLIRKNGERSPIFGGEEKYKLMGYEAADFYRYISDPEKYVREYQKCLELSVMISEFMQQAREKLGVRFTSDAQK